MLHPVVSLRRTYFWLPRIQNSVIRVSSDA